MVALCLLQVRVCACVYVHPSTDCILSRTLSWSFKATFSFVLKV